MTESAVMERPPSSRRKRSAEPSKLEDVSNQYNENIVQKNLELLLRENEGGMSHQLLARACYENGMPLEYWHKGEKYQACICDFYLNLLTGEIGGFPVNIHDVRELKEKKDLYPAFGSLMTAVRKLSVITEERKGLFERRIVAVPVKILEVRNMESYSAYVQATFMETIRRYNNIMGFEKTAVDNDKTPPF